MIPVTAALLSSLLQRPPATTHKGAQGHALLIGGSYGKMGSICLASEAALRAGCGLVTAIIPECGYTVFQTRIPEAMCITSGLNFITQTDFSIVPQAVAIGMGMGQEPDTLEALHHALRQCKSPLVLDADALNLLAYHPSLWDAVPEHTILTPHTKELERLLGTWENDEQKCSKTIQLAKDHKIIVVLKGAPTCIVTPQLVYQNTTGNSALATAGSGDVLSGILAGLLAQGYNPTLAALVGVYLHGLTADLALNDMAPQSFIASDILRYFGKAFKSV